MPDHGIPARDLAIMARVLRPYAEKITGVGLFGSRATGTWRAASDVDLVLHGTLAAADIARIATEFDDSTISRRVDVIAHHLIQSEALRRHVDAVEVAIAIPFVAEASPAV